MAEQPKEQKHITGIDALVFEVPLCRTHLPKDRPPPPGSWQTAGREVRIDVGTMSARNARQLFYQVADAFIAMREVVVGDP